MSPSQASQLLRRVRLDMDFTSRPSRFVCMTLMLSTEASSIPILWHHPSLCPSSFCLLALDNPSPLDCGRTKRSGTGEKIVYRHLRTRIPGWGSNGREVGLIPRRRRNGPGLVCGRRNSGVRPRLPRREREGGYKEAALPACCRAIHVFDDITGHE